MYHISEKNTSKSTGLSPSDESKVESDCTGNYEGCSKLPYVWSVGSCPSDFVRGRGNPSATVHCESCSSESEASCCSHVI